MRLNDTVAVDEDVVDARIDVLANDQGKDPILVESVGPALRGTARLVDGRVLYTPSREFGGPDSFVYFMSDASGDVDWATVHVRVNPVNDPPEAYQDDFSVMANSMDNPIDVLDNDFDVESKPHMYFLDQQGPYPISAVITKPPAHGTLVLQQEGTFLYTPEPGYAGTDSFRYQADDGQDLSNETLARIHVLRPEGHKWVQEPDLTQNGIAICVDSSGDVYRIGADDFLCTRCGPITNVVIWGSWLGDEKGKIRNIHLSFHADDPIGEDGSDRENLYSKPDKLLWQADFQPDQFTEEHFATVQRGEYWWDPATRQLIESGDREIWKISVEIDPTEAFQQQGTRQRPMVYWLDVHVDAVDGRFAWKTRPRGEHFNDDAVFRMEGQLPSDWIELRYPIGHPYHAYGFEDLVLDARYVVGDSFMTSDLLVHARPFQWSNGIWTDQGFARVEDRGLAGGSGKEMQTNNINLDFDFDRAIQGLSLIHI